MSKVAAIQMASGPNVNANLIEAARLIAMAADAGADLVVLPENFAFMGKRDQDQLALCETDGDGPLQDFLARTARKYGVWLVGGTIPMNAGDAGKVRAACLLFDEPRAEEVAELLFVLLRALVRYLLVKFGQLLIDLRQNFRQSLPVEPNSGRLLLESAGGEQGGEVPRQSVEDGRPSRVALLGELRRFPVGSHRVRCRCYLVTEDMRVTTPELRVDSVDDRSQVESILLFRHPSYEHDEEQQVAQLLFKRVLIVLLDGVNDFISLFQRIGRDGVKILLQVPWTACLWLTELRHNFQQAFNRCRRGVVNCHETYLL